MSRDWRLAVSKSAAGELFPRSRGGHGGTVGLSGLAPGAGFLLGELWFLCRAAAVGAGSAIRVLIAEMIATAGRRDGRLLGNLLLHLWVVVPGAVYHELFRFYSSHCETTQRRALGRILRAQRSTAFARERRLGGVGSHAELRRALPILTYDELKPYIERHLHGEADVLVSGKPPRYGRTSGTTSAPKYVPVDGYRATTAHRRITRLWAFSMLKDHPRAFEGKILTITGPPVEGRTPDGTPYGSAFSQSLSRYPAFIKKKYVIPDAVTELEHVPSKYYCICLLGLLSDVSFLSTANPSTLLALAKLCDARKEDLLEDLRLAEPRSDLRIGAPLRRLLDRRLRQGRGRAEDLEALIAASPDGRLRPLDYWPNLRVVACWTGGNCGIFVDRLRAWYGDVPVRELGYIASELRGSVPLGDPRDGAPLTITDNFFEFVPVDRIEQPEAHVLLAHELEVGERYHIVFTNRSGLYRYHINDIVEVKGYYHGNPRIAFVQKGAGVTSLTGEKLYESQAVAAMQAASERSAVAVEWYLMYADVEHSRYELWAELGEVPESADSPGLRDFLARLDRELQQISCEYRAKRTSFRLAPPIMRILAPGSLERYREWRAEQGAREAHLKWISLTDSRQDLGPLVPVATVEPANV